MNLKLLYFAQLREQRGASEDSLEMPAGSTVRDLRHHLLESYPQLKGTLERVAFAINMEYTEDDCRLAEGDSVALIPPVSGGGDDKGN